MQSVYEAAGGSEGLLRLAEAWHSRVMADEIVSHAFSHGFHPQHSERLAGLADDDACTRHDVDPATAGFLAEVWDSYGGCFAEVRLVIPATHHLHGTAPHRDQVPVGGTA
jgi:hypothetical protein